MKRRREEGSFSVHRIGSRKEHRSYFSLYPITSNVDKCLRLRKAERWKLLCSDSEAVFRLMALSGELQPLSTLLESRKVGMALASSTSRCSMRVLCLRFPFCATKKQSIS